MPSASIQIRVPIKELQALDWRAELEGRSRSQQARFYIREGLAGGSDRGAGTSTRKYADAEPQAAA